MIIMDTIFRHASIEDAISDRLFIQEMLNDLARRGLKGLKTWQMLRDWSKELKEVTYTRGRTKKLFYEQIGKEMW